MTQMVVNDTFTRANQSGWGTASDGTDVWKQIVGSATFSVASNKGVVSTLAGTNLTLLGTGVLANGDLLVRFSSTSAASSAGFVLRYTDGNNLVRLEVS